MKSFPLNFQNTVELTTSLPFSQYNQQEREIARLQHSSQISCNTTSFRAIPLCRHALFLIAVSLPGWSAVLGGACALNLLPLWGNLTCAETAHHNFREGIETGVIPKSRMTPVSLKVSGNGTTLFIF